MFIYVYRLAIDARPKWGDGATVRKCPSLLEDFQTGVASMTRKRHLASIARGLLCFCLTTNIHEQLRPRIDLYTRLCLEGSTPEDGSGASPPGEGYRCGSRGAYFVLPTAAILLCGFPSANGRPDGWGGSVRQACLHG